MYILVLHRVIFIGSELDVSCKSTDLDIDDKTYAETLCIGLCLSDAFTSQTSGLIIVSAGALRV